MTGILTLIGLIFVLWLLSKGLQRLGNFMTRVGDSLIDIAADAQKKSHSADDIRQKLDKIQDKIGSLKGDQDAQYREKVRKEIDELTDAE